MKYGNKSLWKRIFYSPVGIFIAAIVFIFILRGAWNVREKALLANERLEQTQMELSDLQNQQKSLSASIAQLSTPAGIETALREKYHAVKQGESVAVIVDNSATDDSSSSLDSTEQSNITTTTKLSWWGSFLKFIGF